MNQKILWKIEELWKQYFQTLPTKTSLDIRENYRGGFSKYYKKFHHVDSFDFTKSQEPVFSDEYGNYRGLEKLQVSLVSGKPVYLIDNHNEMIYLITEISELTKVKYDIVHIDAHPDDAVFEGKKTEELRLEDIPQYISHTRISDFFDAISETKIIGEIFRVCHSDTFEFFLPPEKPYILSLDIDIFGPEGNFAELRDKVRAIALAWAQADAVCIAMSPGFIDQDYATEIVKIFTKIPTNLN